MKQIPVITKGAAEALQLGKNGSYSNEGNVLQHTLYDRTDFQDASVRATTQYFTQPQGQSYMGGNKGLTETNLLDAGKLPNGQTFLIKEVSFAFIPAIVGSDVDTNVLLQAWYNIMQFSVMEIKIAGREFDLQAPGSTFLNPVQVAGRSTIVDATDRVTTTGDFISTGWIKLASTPIPIGQLVTFSVVQRTSAADSDIVTILNGASDVLEAQNAQTESRLRGILTRAI